MSQPSRVVVTGAAAYSCCGFGVQAFWDRMRAGSSANGKNLGEPLRRFTPRDPAVTGDPKITSGHPLAARLLAVVDCDLGSFLRGLKAEEKEQTGVALGSAYAHLNEYLNYYQTGIDQGYQFVNPRRFPATLPSFCTAEVNNAYSLWGSSTTVVSGLAAGLDAISYAAAAIARAEENAMLAVGLEELNDYNQHRLETGGLRSSSGFIRPFAPNRDGTVPGEGLAVLLLQSHVEAQRTGRKPLAEICGFASARGVCWNDPAAPSKAARTVRRALAATGVESREIDAIFPSANGSIAGDEFELLLLKEIFGNELPSIPVFPTKMLIGECFAASGVMQCLAAVYAVGLAPDGPCSTTRLCSNGTGLALAEQIGRRSLTLVYSSGYDGTFSSLIVGRPTV